MKVVDVGGGIPLIFPAKHPVDRNRLCQNEIRTAHILQMMTAPIQRIFDEMSRQPETKILFIFFFILVAFPVIKTVSFVPATIIEPLKTETFSHASEKDPHTELEGKHSHLITMGHTSIQKNGVPFYQAPVYGLNNSAISLETLQIKNSSLLIEEYLSHIYPSHNFW